MPSKLICLRQRTILLGKKCKREPEAFQLSAKYSKELEDLVVARKKRMKELMKVKCKTEQKKKEEAAEMERLAVEKLATEKLALEKLRQETEERERARLAELEAERIGWMEL